MKNRHTSTSGYAQLGLSGLPVTAIPGYIVTVTVICALSPGFGLTTTSESCETMKEGHHDQDLSVCSDVR